MLYIYISCCPSELYTMLYIVHSALLWTIIWDNMVYSPLTPTLHYCGLEHITSTLLMEDGSCLIQMMYAQTNQLATRKLFGRYITPFHSHFPLYGHVRIY